MHLHGLFNRIAIVRVCGRDPKRASIDGGRGAKPDQHRGPQDVPHPPSAHPSLDQADERNEHAEREHRQRRRPQRDDKDDGCRHGHDPEPERERARACVQGGMTELLVAGVQPAGGNVSLAGIRARG